MTPGEAARRLVWALALGAGLGLYYEFLAPLGKRRRVLGDVSFLLGAVWAWVYLGFGVCGGDIRMGDRKSVV